MIKLDITKFNPEYVEKLVAKDISEMSLEEKIEGAYITFTIISQIDEYASFLLSDIIEDIAGYSEEDEEMTIGEFFEGLQFLDEKDINLILKIGYSFSELLDDLE